MTDQKPVVIFGIGDYARIAAHYLNVDSPRQVAAFTVHGSYIDGNELRGLPVVPYEELADTHPPSDYSMLVAIGFSRVNQARAEIYGECKRMGYELISYINSRAAQWGEIEVGDNTFIFEENVIQPFVTIGSDVVLWSGNHIGHDARIGDHCFIASHAVVSGNVEIGDYCFVGVNATFRDGVKVAPRCVIGASALIMKDTEEGAVHAVRGTDARDVKSWDLTNF
jgi:sugar O-acyltransferase (sialic acid O-acetyltransferase NeuD family)